MDQNRFLKNVKKNEIAHVGNEEIGPCWIWLGRIGNQLPLFSWTRAGGVKKQGSTYRYAYELENGEIPKGMMVGPMCQNPCCVRPSHMAAVGRSGAHAPNSKLSEADIEKIQHLYLTTGHTLDDMAYRFRVSIGTIWQHTRMLKRRHQ